VLRFFFAKLREINTQIHGKGNSKKQGDEPNQQSPFAWEEAIDMIAKEYNISWSEVTRMNIYVFNHRAKLLMHKTKKTASNIKKVIGRGKR
jgi:hypothetical protein